MNINQFVNLNKLRPADAIILNKKIFGMLDHYVIYLGVHIQTGKHTFVANHTTGVQLISDKDLQYFLKILIPSQIVRFKGNENERMAAIERGLKRIGEKGYNLLNNNCEHFMNYVHNGVSKSRQSENFLNGITTVAVVGAGLGLLSVLLGGQKK